MAVDKGEVNALFGKKVTVLGAATMGTNVIIRDQLSLYGVQVSVSSISKGRDQWWTYR